MSQTQTLAFDQTASERLAEILLMTAMTESANPMTQFSGSLISTLIVGGIVLAIASPAEAIERNKQSLLGMVDELRKNIEALDDDTLQSYREAYGNLVKVDEGAELIKH
jgi:hypothetical protein